MNHKIITPIEAARAFDKLTARFASNAVPVEIETIRRFIEQALGSTVPCGVKGGSDAAT